MRHPKTRSPRGVGLASTLVVISIIVMLGFTVAGVSFSHLSVSTRLSNAEIAQNRAESVVAMAIDRVITDRESSAPDFNGQLNLTIGAGEPPGSGTVTFDPGGATTLGIPFSTNNISADISKIGDLGRTVPAHGIHVLGVGVCNGVERRVEAILLIPKFPHSIASSGRITSNGGLTVAALDDLSLLTSGGLGAVPPDQIEPGDIACNSTDISQAMYLYGPDIHITGDAKAVGGIQWDETQVQVDGMIQPNSPQSHLPDLEITDYDPAAKPGLVTVSGNQNDLHVNGWTKSTGDLYVSGGLTLESGVLYVDGNLSINGGIQGNGAIIVTGTTEVFGGGAQTTDNMAAILSGGNLTLSATSSDGAQFKGLIYTEGDFRADWVTLGGAAVANKPGGSEVALNNVEVAYNSSATEITIPVGGGGGGGTGGGSFPPAPPPFSSPGLVFQTPTASMPAGNVSVRVNVNMPVTPNPNVFYDSGSNSYGQPVGMPAIDAAQYEIVVSVNGTPQPPIIVTDDANVEARTRQAVLDAGGGATIPTPINVTINAQFAASAAPMYNVNTPFHISTLGRIRSHYNTPLLPIDDMNAYLVDNSPAGDWDESTGPPPPTPVDNFTISINDSTFADLRDKMKVLYWGAPWQ